MLKNKFWLLVVAALFLAMIACESTGDNTGVKVGDSTSSPASTSSANKQDIFKVGDVVDVKDARITLNGGEYKGGVVKLNYSVENVGKSDVNISSLLSFTAKDSEGTKLEQSIMSCGTALDGKILPGDRLKGDICYKMAKDGAFKVYFESSLFSSGAVVWALETSKLTGIPVASGPQPTSASSQTVKTYKAGEVIEVQGQKITLNTTALAGDILKANFTIENTGKTDVAVSSLMSFDAKNLDGTKLEISVMNCGTSMDGKVLPNDKLKGDVCWKLGGVKTAKIYYQASLLGSGAIVWEVK